MKTLALIWIAATLAAGTAFAQSNDGFRAFTDLKDRSIRARIVDYDPAKVKLLVEREDHQRTWVDAAVFCQNDQTYIQDWLDSYDALSEEALAVMIEPKEGPLLEAGARAGKHRKKSRYCCILSVEKHSNIPVEGFRIEYRYFVTDDQASTGLDNLRQYGGEFLIGSVTNGQTLTFKTDAINLVSEYDVQEKVSLFGKSYDEILVRKDCLLGVWIKICGSSPSGIPVVRDICDPEDLYEKVVWDNESTMLKVP